MEKIRVENIEYELVREYKNGFCLEDFLEKYTDYFEEYDYVFGDYSYDQLRLKGFFDVSNKKVKQLNSIDGIDTYIRDYCSYECRYFLLKKVKKN